MKHTTLITALITALLMAACSPTQVKAPVYTIIPAEPEAPAAAKKAAQPIEVPAAYTIKSGDTLIGIALYYDLDHRELARWNNLRDPDIIQVGQRLKLRPPANDPAVTIVQKKQAPALKLVAESTAVTKDAENAENAENADSVESTNSAAVEAADSKEDSGATKIQRQSAIISGQKASPAPAAGTAPYKTEPQVIKYAYSSALLKKLQKAWQERKVSTPAAAAPPPKPAAAAATAVNAPAKTNQRYGIVWSLPSAGAVLQKYSTTSKGIDFDGKKGDPVYAAADGVVIYIGTGVKSYGRLVILRHKNNYLSAYAHNDEILVKEDQNVSRGSKIAVMGDSGSERVMLHFEVRKGGKPVDPALVLPK